MAKKHKAKHHDHKETDHAEAHHAKKTNWSWVVGLIVVILIIVLVLVYWKPIQQPSGEETTEGAETGEQGKTEKAPSEATILNEKVREGRTSGEFNIAKGEGKSWFSGIKCTFGDKTGSSTAKEDLLDFQLTNQGTKAYTLRYVTSMELLSNKALNPMRIDVNGRRVRNLKEACGAEELKAGETLNCKGAQVLLRSGTSKFGAELVNEVSARSQDATSRMEFKC